MKHPKLKHLILVGIQDLQEEHFERLQNLCLSPIIIVQKMEEVLALGPQITQEIKVLLVKREITVNEKHLKDLPALEYVGVYGTSLKDIHVPSTVNVRGVFLYCDADTAEFVLIESFKLIRHLGGNPSLQWKQMPESINGLKLGIIGLGAVGLELAKLMSAHGVEIYYTCHHPSKDEQANKWHFVPMEMMEELYVVSNIISIHTPYMNEPFLDKSAFDYMRKDCILVNTSLGTPINTKHLQQWLKETKGFFISDSISTNELKIDFTHPRMNLVPQYAYKTISSMSRLGEGLVGELEKWLN